MDRGYKSLYMVLRYRGYTFLSDRVEILEKPQAKHINPSKKLGFFAEEYKKTK